MLIHEIAATQTDFNIEDLFEIEDGISGVSKKGTLENIIRKIISENASSRIIPSNFTLSYVGVTTFGIAAGKVLDDTFVSVLNFPSAFTKTLSAWAVGTGNGSLDTGSVAASTTYHVYLIRKDSDGSVDIIISLSSTSPTMPSGYTYKKYIGRLPVNGSSQIIKFYQHGNMFRFDAQQNDKSDGVIANTNRNLLTVSAPENTIGIFDVSIVWTSAASERFLIIQATEETDSTPSITNHTLRIALLTERGSSQIQIYIDSSRQIAYRGDSTSISLRIGCNGWIDPLI